VDGFVSTYATLISLALFGDGPDWTNSKFLKKLLKINLNILIFISHQSFFIIIQIKKSLQNKKISFFLGGGKKKNYKKFF
jgi:hypothetical protein